MKMKIRKNKFSIKQVKIAAFLVCLGGILAAGFFSLLSFYNNYSSKEEAVYYKESLAELAAKRDDITGFIQKFKDDKAQIEAVLFKGEDVASFLEEISRFARVCEVRIIDMVRQKFKEVACNGNAEEDALSNSKSKKIIAKNKSAGEGNNTGETLFFLPIKMKIEGEFKNIVDFLTFLEGHKQRVNLTDVSIEVKKYPVLECKYDLNIYTLQRLLGEEAK